MLMSEIVDFKSPIPRYSQISNWFEEMINMMSASVHPPNPLWRRSVA